MVIAMLCICTAMFVILVTDTLFVHNRNRKKIQELKVENKKLVMCCNRYAWENRKLAKKINQLGNYQQWKDYLVRDEREETRAILSSLAYECEKLYAQLEDREVSQ